MFSLSTKLRWISLLPVAVSSLFFFTSAPAQIHQTGRYETVIQENDRDDYQVVNVHDQGIVLYRRLSTVPGNQIELVRVDTALHEAWRGYMQLNLDESILFTIAKDDALYFLIRSRHNIAGDYTVAMMKIGTGTYYLYPIRNLIPFIPTEFTIAKGSALVGGYFNYRPLILHYNLRTQQPKILPGFFNETGELTQMKPNRDGSVDVIVSAKNVEKRKSLWIRNYDSLGNLIKTTVLEPEEKKHLIFGRSLKMPDGQQVVSGVYGRYTDYSRGMFVASINVMGEYTIQYYAFSDLQHFFRYMKARREQRVKEKIERRKVKGKKVRFNYRVLVQELIPYGNQYLLLGEAFYPHYIYRNNVQLFDGYQYTHAVVIAFDKNGKLRWDNSFEINDVRTFFLEQFVKIAADDDRIVLLYLYENAIRSKIISGADVLEGKSLEEMKLKFDGDEVNKSETVHSKLDYWYGNNFIAYGTQKIQNRKNTSVPASRKVFFVNRITHIRNPD